MERELLNREWIPGNVCFGCGHDNPIGLKIDVTRDEENPDRLVGRLRPKDDMIGFPGITHGGAIYTALDCMSAWTPAVLRPKTRALWILRSATVKYLRPARQGRPIELSGTIEREQGPWDPMTVRAEARDPEGNLLVEGSFKVIPLDPERFKEVAGVDRLPDNWLEFLRRRGE